MGYKIISAEEAALHIENEHQVGIGGFTAAGSPKVVPSAIAKRAIKFHSEGKPFKINLYTGASTSTLTDDVLAAANAVNKRTPYQGSSETRKNINRGEITYFDLHLSLVAQELRYGFFGKLDVAIVEIADITDEGEITLTNGVGITPTVLQLADKVILERNSYIPKNIRGIHDIYTPQDPPRRETLPIFKPSDRAGEITVKIDPKKVIGIVETNVADGVKDFAPLDDATRKIGENVASFLAKEYSNGKIPKEFLPIQSGVGNIANAVLGCLGKNSDIPPFEMYTEVVQDSVIELMKSGRCKFASSCSLTLTEPYLQDIYKNFEFFKDKLVLRPSEISNNPAIVRRLGLITINTALEVDIYGNVNSTHVTGSKMMNGIGGSGDFARNAYISIFTCPSIAKGGKISAIVPMVSHLDHSEHSVKVIVTEQGVADLRGKSPVQRAEEIINNCVHPMYREKMREYLASCTNGGHTPHNLRKCFEFHNAFIESGDMMNAEF